MTNHARETHTRTVQARFWVANLETPAWMPDGAGIVHLQPTSRGPENKDWSAATPAGKIEMTISNPEAFAFFQERRAKDVAITFEDRPLICDHCKAETGQTDSANYTKHSGPGGTGLDRDMHLHHQCFKDITEFKEAERRT